MLVFFSALLAAFGIVGSPSITTSALPQAKVGVPYTFTWTATGGKLPYRWRSISTLPSGLTLSQNGVLSGTPKSAGTFSVLVRVTDIRSKTAAKTLSLTVTQPTPAPAPLVIQTMTIPNGMVGKPYSFQIKITGGTPPYTCTLDPNNNLAEFGLMLDTSCLLHGMPLKAGAVHF